MISTSKDAMEFFGSELMLKHDQEMIDYSAGELFTKFYGKCLAAAVLPALDDMKNKHAAISSNGPLATPHGSIIQAFSFPNDQFGLAVEYAAGNRDLIVWGPGKSASDSTDREMVDVYLISLLPEMPQALSDKIETMLETGSTLEAFARVAPEVARYARRVTSEKERPSLLQDVVARIEERGMENVCWRISAGSVKVILNSHDERFNSAVGITRDFSHPFEIIERFMRTFEPKDGKVFWELRQHTQLVRNGTAVDMFGSVSAYLFERAIAAHIDDLEEIATIASELRLGAGTVLAYNDTDIRLSVEELDEKTVYRHDNIDRNEQNVFVTVINRTNGEPTSIDAYFAETWSHDFAVANGLDNDEPLDREHYDWLIESTRDREGKLKDDELVRRLETGRPSEGLAYSYDLAGKTLEVHPQAARTGYLGYASHMIENDLEILRKVRAGKYGSGPEFQVRNHEEGARADVDHIPAEKYMKGLAAAGATARGLR
ncbi:hypothetical protein HFO56_39235 [Rhizobium laguerreae]|uniref:hypothetical protein n=1 Tax=Rhizobium laguerreae TaxID=1076926 RepID=UPI001C914295|nr:hypothetical protein [Rhizobium laguerreae]MBY3158335.1 hypothetical protein [Rhizobium laguerreae]